MASETKFTPGPWVTCDAHGPVEDGTSIQSSLDTHMVASCCHYYSREQVRANARLIAAAPELYLELKMLCNCIEGCGLEDLPPEVEAQISSSREALAKARGEA